jgi:hypothetical protein
MKTKRVKRLLRLQPHVQEEVRTPRGHERGRAAEKGGREGASEWMGWDGDRIGKGRGRDILMRKKSQNDGKFMKVLILCN